MITLHEGESVAMSGSYEPASHFRDGKVIYSVEDTTVATVDENGVLTAVSEGSTILYASVDIYDAVREYSVTVSPVSEYILGDTDGDGNVTIVDATMIQRYDAQMITLSKSALKRSDVDRDDDVNIIDVTFIQRWLVDLPSKKEIGTVISE